MIATTGVAVTIHACSPQSVRAVFRILVRHGLTENIDAATAKFDVLTLDESKWGFELECGSAMKIANELMIEAPDVIFTAFDEPAEGHQGTVCMYVPELGPFRSACDADGEPLLKQKLLLAMEGETAEVRRRFLGVPWVTAIAALPGGLVRAA